MKATLAKQRTDDGNCETDAPIGKQYLVDLDSIKDSNPGFADHPGLRTGPRATILTLCECRRHYAGEMPLEMLRIEANA